MRMRMINFSLLSLLKYFFLFAIHDIILGIHYFTNLKILLLISDADEDDQLAAAIAASLKETTQSTSKVLGTNSDSDDSDSEFFEESFSAENSNSASTLPSFSSKNYAKLVESAKSK